MYANAYFFRSNNINIEVGLPNSEQLKMKIV